MDIHIENLQKSFGDKMAVNIEQLNIQQGMLLGVVGNNGAGKTTLFRLMLDLLKADRGRVLFDETDVATTEAWKRWTGAFIDERFLIDYLTPEEYFEFVGKVNGLDKKEVYARLERFEMLANGEILGRKILIRSLSAGNKQKVGIIGAMLNHPRLLILDEPFNFLDPSSQNHMKNLLRTYNDEKAATIIVSSHNLMHTVDISKRVVLMEHGAILRNLINVEGSAADELTDYFNAK